DFAPGGPGPGGPGPGGPGSGGPGSGGRGPGGLGGGFSSTLQGHTDWVQAVAFSPDGRFLATASLDRSIRLWDAESGEQIQALTALASGQRSLAFSPDGKWLASAGTEDSVKLWPLVLVEENLKD